MRQSISHAAFSVYLTLAMKTLVTITFSLAVLSGMAQAQSTLSTAGEGRCVVLLHGLARTETSFALMEAALETEGYTVVRPGYPSTTAPVEELPRRTLPDAVAAWGRHRSIS